MHMGRCRGCGDSMPSELALVSHMLREKYCLNYYLKHDLITVPTSFLKVINDSLHVVSVAEHPRHLPWCVLGMSERGTIIQLFKGTKKQNCINWIARVQRSPS